MGALLLRFSYSAAADDGADLADEAVEKATKVEGLVRVMVVVVRAHG